MAEPTLDLIVMTYNEALNLERCLESVQSLAKNIFVVDSGSTDHTLDIARQYQARIVTHDFTTQAEQFNWALDHLPIASEWVLRLDGDEYLLPELRNEIAQTLPKLPREVTGLYIKRRMIFLGRWIRHGGYYPIWLLRLFRYGSARYEEIALNEHMVLLKGKTLRLKYDLVDLDSDGLAAWTLKHESFAVRQARVLCQLQEDYEPRWIPKNLFGEQAEQKRWLFHHIYRRLPLFLRALLYFFYRYFLRLGFLDGKQGLVFHFLHGCWYPFYTDAKIYAEELKQKKEVYPSINS